MAALAYRVRIRGLVQGVAFRWSMQREADRLGVAGWVRNRRDGSVEALVQGEEAAVRGLLDWSRRGPPGAHVTSVDATPTPPDTGLSDFTVEATTA
ncbi:MAG TPA: acylphosphatase [Chloroflexota bacterium]|nr:acylphosphatase [Chloroflexota bacterium]